MTLLLLYTPIGNLSERTPAAIPGNSNALSYQSSYDIGNNITVGQNATLKFSDTNISVISHHAVWIHVSGSLILNGSSISLLYPGQGQLNLVSGNNSRILFLNSKIDVSGAFHFDRSTVTVLNSSISSPGPASMLNRSLRISFASSHVLISNSTVSGLFRTSAIKYRNSSYYNYTGSSPISNTGNIPLHEDVVSNGSEIASAINVSVQVSGNNPYSNSLEFNYAGERIGSYDLPSTGSVFRKENLSFSIKTGSFGISLSQINSGLSVGLNLSYATGSNSTLWKFSSTVISNDTSGILGHSYFNYLMSNTSAILLNSTLGINSNRPYLDPGLQNPDKNAVALSNSSTLFFIDSSISNTSGSFIPFFLDGNSSLYSMEDLNVRPESHGISVTNYTFATAPANLNGALNGAADSAQAYLSTSLDQFSARYVLFLNSLVASGLILSDAIMTGHSVTMTPNYNLTVDGITSGITLPGFPYYSLQSVYVSPVLALPDIIATLNATASHFDTNDSVTFSLHSMYYSSENISWNLSLILNNSSSEFAHGKIGRIMAGQYANITSFYDPGNESHIESAGILLSLSFANYTATGKCMTKSGNIVIYPSVYLRLSGSCRWLPDSRIMLYVNVTNTGNQALNSSVLDILSLSGGTTSGNSSVIFNVSGHSSYSYNSLFNGNVTGFRLTVTTKSGVSESHVLRENMTVKTDREYNLTLHENGLPSGKTWSVEINGRVESSSTDNITFREPFGTYSFSVRSVPGFRIAGRKDSANLSTGSETLQVNFTVYTYSVTVRESGLPPYSEWSVLYGNSNHPSTHSTDTINLPNGTYAFSFSGPSEYTAAPSNVTVSGHNITVSVNFINHSVPPGKKIIAFLSENWYILVAVAGISLFFSYRRFHDSVKICRKCFTSYRGFGKCPVCSAKVAGNVRKEEK